MTSQSGNSHTESLITLDRATYEFWQQELVTLRHDNEQLRRELVECNQSHRAAIHQLSAELEAKFAQQNKELLDKVAELQAILDNSPALIYVKDTQGRFLLINHQLETLLHLTKGQIQGKSNYEIFPKEIADVFWQNDQQVLNAGIALWFEEVALQDDGLHTYLSIKFPLFNAEGIAYAVCGISTDISDRKQADEARFRLAAIVESSDDAIISKTLDGIIVSWNAGAEQIFGYQAAEVIGQSITLLVPDDRLDEEPQILKRLKRGERIEHFETIRKRKDGTLINLSLTISPVRDANGNIIGASKIARDISERKQAETQLSQRTEELENTLQELQRTQMQMVQSEKMSGLGQLVAGVAHEINNPVNFISGNLNHADVYTQDLLGVLKLYQRYYPTPHLAIQQEAEHIDLEFLTEDLPKLLSSMKVGADRIQKIVVSLRNFSRMDEAEMKEVNIHDGIDSTLMILQHRLKAKPDFPRIEVIKAYGELPLVECYVGQLNQVFMNILSNAIDALEECRIENAELRMESKKTSQFSTPTITICTSMIDTQRVQIVISDNGPGMTETVRKQLFDPFFTTKPVGKGTGMGMSISYQIITEKHQGSLQCISSLGQKTEFVIEIPVQQHT